MITSDELYALAKEASKRLRATLMVIAMLRETLARSLQDPNSPKQSEEELRRALVEWQFRAKRRAQAVARATATAQRCEQLETWQTNMARVPRGTPTSGQAVRAPRHRPANPAHDAKRTAEADFRRRWLSGCPKMARIAPSLFGFRWPVCGAFKRGKRK